MALCAASADRRRVTSPASDRKSTRLNSSHVRISYAVLCLKKKIVKLNVTDTLRALLPILKLHAVPDHHMREVGELHFSNEVLPSALSASVPMSSLSIAMMH